MKAVSVYLITNLVNGKVYVGKSVNPVERWRAHKKIAIGGKEKYPDDFFAVHAALHKYGINNFRFEIIDRFDSEREAFSAESVMIQLSCSNFKKYGYNCNLGGEGGIVPSEETRQKLIASANTPERIKIASDMMKNRHQNHPGFLSAVHKGNQYTKGRILPQEEKDHLSKILTGRIVSENTKLKISGENNKTAKLTEKDVLEIRAKHVPGQYGCNKSLAEEYGVNVGTIERVTSRRSWKHI